MNRPIVKFIRGGNATSQTSTHASRKIVDKIYDFIIMTMTILLICVQVLFVYIIICVHYCESLIRSNQNCQINIIAC